MSLVLGAIADDFTGATDLANNLVRAGMRTVQVLGVPGDRALPDNVDAVVVALKSRSCPVNEAIADSLAALGWLKARGAKQIFFKYCSTFDSTGQGNIGPVADALLDRLNAEQTVMVPAFPATGRTVYQGHLFVGDRLLNDSGMQDHPLNPMTDADLVRVLGRQTSHRVGAVSHAAIAAGAGTVRERLERLHDEEVRHVICDTLDDADLDVLAEACVDHELVTGGSGLGLALPAQYRRKGWLMAQENAARLSRAEGYQLVLSGSCSRATLGQVAHFLEHHSGLALDPLELAASDAAIESALDFARDHYAQHPDKPVLIYASAAPESIKAAQQKLGVAKAGAVVEAAMARLAVTLVKEGVGRLLVAGGETSGAVVSALALSELRIGPQIDVGVPWTQAQVNGRTLSLALKSGNFGGVDIFSRAFQSLDAADLEGHTA
ncbi:3-oxo-tetronate kinase [Halomonas binhaiensis]|uniref:3-oxo-tetronate kinase n=1 Tax=Halomonas binhaiensis TaxID=2562282 RepID=A0A5C1NLV9_9GAMM|nr:3-oxo-tetronate kinase [Halomonas binhaiensis]QEM83135.1 four-carbon acid sugar kinase family protein [Halomonas binhaiensis]